MRLHVAPVLIALCTLGSVQAQDTYALRGTFGGEPLRGRARAEPTPDGLLLELRLVRDGKQVRWRGKGKQVNATTWRFLLEGGAEGTPKRIDARVPDGRLELSLFDAEGKRGGAVGGPRVARDRRRGATERLEDEVIEGRLGVRDAVGRLAGEDPTRPDDIVISGRLSDPPDLRGKKAGWWDGWLNSDLTITDPIGRYRTREDALRAAREHDGAAVVLRNGPHYDVYGVDDNSRYDLTLDNVEQVDGYSVTNLRTSESEVGKPSALVLEDGAVVEPSRSRFSPSSYTVDREASREWNAERVADALHRSMSGAGTDEEALFEALASLPPAERGLVADAFRERHGGDLDAWLNGDLSNVLADRRQADHMLNAEETILSRAEMRRQFDAELDRREGQLSDSSSVFSTPQLAWHLGNYGNVVGEGTLKKFTTGQEYALKQAIERDAEAKARRLTPGEVYGLALDLNGGDKFKATLTAHNTLRAMGRGMDPHLRDQVPERTDGRAKEWFGSGGNDGAWFSEHLTPIRGGRDEGGAWYHLFGVAAMSMTGGETSADTMVGLEEYTVSKDAWSDPLELRVDRMGAELGTQLSE